jgi:hypothetical protein
MVRRRSCKWQAEQYLHIQLHFAADNQRCFDEPQGLILKQGLQELWASSASPG